MAAQARIFDHLVKAMQTCADSYQSLISGDVCPNLRSAPLVTGHISPLLRSSDPLSDHPHHVTPSRVTAAASQITTPNHIQIRVLQFSATLTLLTRCHSAEFANLQGWVLQVVRTEGDPGGSSPAEASWGRNGPIAAPGTVALDARAWPRWGLERRARGTRGS